MTTGHLQRGIPRAFFLHSWPAIRHAGNRNADGVRAILLKAAEICGGQTWQATPSFTS